MKTHGRTRSARLLRRWTDRGNEQGGRHGNLLTEGLKEQGEDYLREMAESIPTRALCEPQGIAYAVCFLSSPEARYITGQTLIVDGGQVLPESFEALK